MSVLKPSMVNLASETAISKREYNVDQIISHSWHTGTLEEIVVKVVLDRDSR